MIVGVNVKADGGLSEIVHALALDRFGFRLCKGWQEHAGEDRDDCDDDEEFDQSECDEGSAV
jgi:hypothetical protein